MAINKYVHLGEVKFDITDSTVTSETLAEGVIAYGANGERIVGTNAGGSGIIEVTELPTENIDTEAFYLCNGEYYRYVEGGNTWVFNDELTKDTSLSCEFAFEFEGYANTKNGTKLSYASFGGSSCPRIEYKTDYYPAGQTGNYQSVIVYDYDGSYTGSVGWQKEEYKTITINEMPADEAFLTWLNANAKPADGWVKYIVPNDALSITENGNYDISQYASAIVKVPMPSGDITITENGEFDVGNYEKAIVDIPPVIEINELPTEDINSEAVYICNGDLYRYSPSETWTFNDTITKLGEDAAFRGEFIFIKPNGEKEVGTLIMSMYSQVTNYLKYDTGRTESTGQPIWYGVYNYDNHYENPNTWENECYKTITFTEQIPEGEFRTWLEANATCIAPPSWSKYSLVTE